MTWQISKQRAYSILMVNCNLSKPFSLGNIIIKKYGMALSIDDVAHELCIDKYDIQDIINANELTLTNIGTKQWVLVTSLINYIYKLNNQLSSDQVEIVKKIISVRMHYLQLRIFAQGSDAEKHVVSS